MIFHRLSLCAESKAFSKSTKCTYRPALHSFACSKMFLSINICSVVLLLGRNPACSFQSFLSMPFLICHNHNLQNILPLTGSKVTPLQLLHLRKSSVLNTLTTSSFLPHFWPPLNFPKPVVTTSQPTCSVFHVSFHNSGHTSSTLAAFPGFVLFNASLTSCNHHLPRSTSSISSDSTISSSSTGFFGSSVINISLSAPPISAVFLLFQS